MVFFCSSIYLMNLLTRAPSFYRVEMMLPLSIIIYDYDMEGKYGHGRGINRGAKIRRG
jgi:hypothetical protein